MMKRKWSTYGFIFLLVAVTSSFLTCQCGEDMHERVARVASQSNDCCHPMEREKAPVHPEKDCCGQCFSSSAMSVYLNRATFTVNVSDVLDAEVVVSKPEQNEPQQYRTTVHEEGVSFFLTHVFKTAYSSQAPPLA